MRKELEGLSWVPMWVSHLGCLKGCLNFLGRNVSTAWVFGATGHAFIINMHDVVCPSGPTAWRKERFIKLFGNIGCSIDSIVAIKTEKDFAEKQKAAWEMVQKAIDQKIPCIGWEMKVPEYYVIAGYDETGYRYSGAMCEGIEGPRPWNEVGTGEIGVIEVQSVENAEPADDKKTVKEALAFALEFAQSPDEFVFPLYKAGVAGFDNWINALESGRAHEFGMPYNSAVWSECRSNAVKFLEEAAQRLDSDLAPMFEKAIGHYRIVSENLAEVAKMFPFPPKGGEVNDTALCARAAERLKPARDAEEKGLETLKAIHDVL